jgi:hypothetical protein
MYKYILKFVAVHNEYGLPMQNAWYEYKVREIMAVRVLHTSLMNIAVITFKVLPLGNYIPMSASSPPIKIIWELVCWNGLQSCHHINSAIRVIK